MRFRRTALLFTAALLLAAAIPDTADAWRLFGRRRYRTYTNYSYGSSYAYGSFGSTPAEVAQAKANLLASRGYGFHPGGGYGGASYEGWGMGSTPTAAMCNACYYGQRSIAATAQAQSANGTWFSINLYW